MEKQKSQFRIGVILNYLNMGAGSLIPIFYTPVMLALLGQSEYGLYKLSSSVTSYLSLISMGLGAAVTRYLIKAMTQEGKEAEQRVLGLFLVIFRIIAAVSFAVGIVLCLNLNLWYGASLTQEQLGRMRIIVFLLVCNTSLSFLVAPFMSVVGAHERYVFQQIMAVCTTCVLPIVNLIVLYLGGASVGMAVSSLSVNLVVRTVYLYYVRRSLDIRPSYQNLPKHLVREIFMFSFWIFVSNLVNQLHSATDTVMIGAVPALATTGVAVYSVGATFNTMTQTLTTGVSTLLAPRTNKMVFAGATNRELTDYAIRIGRIQAYLVALVVSGFVSFGRPFIESFYAGKGYQDSYWVALLMMIPSMIPLVQSVCYNIIVAQNKHRFRSLVYLATAVSNVIATWFAMKVMGVIGAALMTGVTALLGSGLTINWYYARKIHLEMGRFWRRVGVLYLIPVLMSAATLLLGRVVNFYSRPVLLLGIAVYTVIYAGLNWLLMMNAYEKELLLSPLRKLLRRTAAKG